jgi:hypothetical protein
MQEVCGPWLGDPGLGFERDRSSGWGQAQCRMFEVASRVDSGRWRGA